jgi:hypothetical protein
MEVDTQTGLVMGIFILVEEEVILALLIRSHMKAWHYSAILFLEEMVSKLHVVWSNEQVNIPGMA